MHQQQLLNSSQSILRTHYVVQYFWIGRALVQGNLAQYREIFHQGQALEKLVKRIAYTVSAFNYCVASLLFQWLNGAVFAYRLICYSTIFRAV
jgi:hypothetical protein